MQKSTKYRKHYASKKKNPTRSVHKASITPGHKRGLQEIEKRLGRKLVLPEGHKVKTVGGNWVWRELRNPVAA